MISLRSSERGGSRKSNPRRTLAEWVNPANRQVVVAVSCGQAKIHPTRLMSGKAAATGKGAAARGPGKKGPPNKDGVIVSVEEKVWTLRMGARDPPCNVARFEEMWVGKGDSKRKVRSAPVNLLC